jgi:hypothetical protein
LNKCALVSVNGGWNLLIGTQTTTGAYVKEEVPPECATVWDEAAKDACFEGAAWRTIAQSPGRWLARAPSKLAVTLDYFGAAPWYLNATNGEAFGPKAKVRLVVVETLVSRVLLAGALIAVGLLPGARPFARKAVAVAGLAATLAIPDGQGFFLNLLHGWMGYLALTLTIGLLGLRALVRAPLLAMTAATIAATMVVHAMFFGAGRYGLVVVPFVAATALFWPAPAPASAPAGEANAS